MSIKRISRASALACGGLIAGTATAAAAPNAEELPKAGYQCRTIGPENRVEPPPPLSPIKLDSSAQTAAIRDFVEKNKISEYPCPRGEVAYPKSYFPTARKSNPWISRELRTPMSPSGTRTPRRSGDIQDDQDPTRTKYRYVSKYYDTDTHGVSIEINVANPEVEESGVSQSIAQLAASGEVGDMDTVELGWRVSRWEAGPRLFTYVNKDNYATHGQPGGDCYNCNFIPLPGADYVPGQALVPSSISTETLQFGVRLIDDNWWVWVGDQWIGYLDGDFWPGTTEYSNSHVFYGEVYDDGEGTTDMGNGRWGHELNSSVMMNPTASYFKNGGWVTVDEPIDPTRGSPLWSSVASRYDGYEAYGARSRSWKFGGPGTG